MFLAHLLWGVGHCFWHWGWSMKTLLLSWNVHSGMWWKADSKQPTEVISERNTMRLWRTPNRLRVLASWWRRRSFSLDAFRPRPAWLVSFGQKGDLTLHDACCRDWIIRYLTYTFAVAAISKCPHPSIQASWGSVQHLRGLRFPDTSQATASQHPQLRVPTKETGSLRDRGGTVQMYSKWLASCISEGRRSAPGLNIWTIYDKTSLSVTRGCKRFLGPWEVRRGQCPRPPAGAPGSRAGQRRARPPARPIPRMW